MSQVETQAATITQELSRKTTQARALEVRVRVLEHDRETDKAALAATRAELDDARVRIKNLRTEME